jgi:hypothetical protein
MVAKSAQRSAAKAFIVDFLRDATDDRFRALDLENGKIVHPVHSLR